MLGSASGPDGELICTWELKKDAPAMSASAIASGLTDSSSVDRSRACKSREHDLWRWLVVAGLAAGYVFTGVAYFMGRDRAALNLVAA